MRHTLFFIFLLVSTSVFSQNKNQSIGFKENKGQIIDQKGKPNPEVKYLLNTNGLNVQIKTKGFSYDIYEAKKHPLSEKQKAKLQPSSPLDKDKKTTPDYSLEYLYHRIDIDFVNSNPKVELVAEEKSKDYDNYYNIPNKPDGVLMVHQYQQITYKNIYPNIDVVFSIPKDSLKTVEYNFVVHPKGKISDIQMKFSGAKTDLVDNKIKMQVRFGAMEETLPMSWTEDGKCKKEVAVGYKKIKNNVYGFESSENVSGKTVVIDPVPTRLWGTYYGGEYFVNFTDIDSDKDGSIYFSGNITEKSNIYATSGAHQTTSTNTSSYGIDGIIAKFNTNGIRIWGTYYGGLESEKINGLIIDNNNNVIITGVTRSDTNISTIGSYMPIKATKYSNTNDNEDAFIVKFSSNGVRLWGTYLGGIADDYGNDVDIDSNNNIYVVGRTNSTTGISINNNFQIDLNRETTSYPDRPDGFLSKFNSNGNILWSTYAGGENDDYFKVLKVSNNFLVIGGRTESQNHISTPGVFQEKLYVLPMSNNIDGTIYKFTLDGKRLWSSYYGGESSVDEIESIESDDEDNIYIGGNTYSINNMATPGSFKDTNSYNSGFLAKLNPNGKRVWGTYIADDIMSIISNNNSIYVCGRGPGYDESITTNCAYRKKGVQYSSGEGYLGKFSKDCELIFGTYVGGRSQVYEYTKACIDDNNEIIVAGNADINNGIADSNSYQPVNNGQTNFYLIKFKETNVTGIPNPESNSPICIGNTLELKASGGTTYSWTGPNGFTSKDQNPTIPNATAVNSGQYSCAITGTGGCDDIKTVDVLVGDAVAPIPNLANLPTITGDCHTTITTIPTATDNCAGTITATTTNPLSYSLPGTYTIAWNYDDGNGNSVTQNQTVSISSQPLPTTTSPQTFCIQQNATLNNILITGQNIKWHDALINGNLLATTTLLQNGLTYFASQTINGCESERIPVLINIQNTPLPTADTNQSFCTSQNPTIATIQITGDSIKWYDNYTNGNLLPTTMNLQNGKTYYASQTLNNCESERLGVTVSIVNTPSAPTANATESFCKNINATLNEIQITGQNIKWYDTNSAVASLPISTLLEDNKTYYASQTIGCESNKIPVLVRIYNTPLPTANKNQQFCIDENATISNLTVTASNIKWYDKPTNGIILAETTLLQDGQTYYATQTLNNCESERLAITVNVQNTQSPIANSPQTFCIQKNAKISDIAISGQNINWFKSASSTIILSESTLLENGIIYYASKTINNCESDRIPVTITILEATSEDCINLVDELPYPKFFTPNNDGHNDTWTIDFAYLAPNTGIKILDRYGKLIKMLSNITDGWNGTFNGAELPATDYWFVVTRANGTEYKGHFSLKR